MDHYEYDEASSGDESPDEYGAHESEDVDEDDSDHETVDEAQALREQLRDVPLGEIKRLKNKVGLKKYNQVLFGFQEQNEEDNVSEDEDEESGISAKKLKNRKRENTEIQKGSKKKAKSEPEEFSSKKRTFGDKPRHVVKNNKKSIRDPRFSDLSGNFNEQLFEKSYSFVKDIKKGEYETVNKQLKKVKNPEERERLIRLKQKMDNEKQSEIDKAKKRELAKQRRANLQEQTSAGQKPFYLKNSDKKKIELAEKYRELKASGKLEKFMSKKRKRNTQKDKRNLPKMKV